MAPVRQPCRWPPVPTSPLKWLIVFSAAFDYLSSKERKVGEIHRHFGKGSSHCPWPGPKEILHCVSLAEMLSVLGREPRLRSRSFDPRSCTSPEFWCDVRSLARLRAQKPQTGRSPSWGTDGVPPCSCCFPEAVRVGRDLDFRARKTTLEACLGCWHWKWPEHGEKMTSLKSQHESWADGSLAPGQLSLAPEKPGQLYFLAA